MNISKKIDDFISEHLTIFFENQNNLYKEICLYSLKDGKRIRPSITYDICNTLSNNKIDMNFACLAIEYIHCSSLIIDDLPCMDNALLRRNKECVHIKYGEPTAHLISIILFSLALDSIQKGILYNNFDINIQNKIREFYLTDISKTIFNASNGQLLDLILDNKIENNIYKNIDYKDIITKTSMFFETSFLLGWIFGNGDISKISDVKRLSFIFSMLYQIIDDIEDIDEDKKENSLKNYVNKYGKDKAIEDAKNYLIEFTTLLNELNLESEFFITLIQYLKSKIKN